MIEKLYKLKKTQLNQQFMLKKQLLGKISDIDKIINNLQQEIVSMGVKKFGAIGDFKILAIHKDSMKYQQRQMEKQRKELLAQVYNYDKAIVEYQKDVEKYNYILKEELKTRMKEEQKNEELVANEYIQSKYIAKMVQNG